MTLCGHPRRGVCPDPVRLRTRSVECVVRLFAEICFDAEPMRPDVKAMSIGSFIEAKVRGELGRVQAMRLCRDNSEIITLALPGTGLRIYVPIAQMP